MQLLISCPRGGDIDKLLAYPGVGILATTQHQWMCCYVVRRRQWSQSAGFKVVILTNCHGTMIFTQSFWKCPNLHSMPYFLPPCQCKICHDQVHSVAVFRVSIKVWLLKCHNHYWVWGWRLFDYHRQNLGTPHPQGTVTSGQHPLRIDKIRIPLPHTYIILIPLHMCSMISSPPPFPYWSLPTSGCPSLMNCKICAPL